MARSTKRTGGLDDADAEIEVLSAADLADWRQRQKHPKTEPDPITELIGAAIAGQDRDNEVRRYWAAPTAGSWPRWGASPDATAVRGRPRRATSNSSTAVGRPRRGKPPDLPGDTYFLGSTTSDPKRLKFCALRWS